MIKVKIPSTGAVLNLPPLGVSGMQMQLMRVYPKPKPPSQTVVIAGVDHVDINPFNEDYIASVEAWEESIQERLGDFMFRKIAYAQYLTEDQKKDVAQFREDFNDLPLPENDRLLWLYNFALPDEQDEINKILESAKSQRNMFEIDNAVLESELSVEPDQEAVDSYREAFQPEVQGS